MRREGLSSLSMTVVSAALVTAMLAAGGCKMVSRQEYTDLQQEYTRLGEVNRSLSAELKTANANEARLMADLLAARQDKNQAEMELTRLRGENVQASTPAPVGDAPEGWEILRGGAQVSLGSDVLFASGKAALTDAGRKRIAEVASTIRSKYAGSTVGVYGHTDNVPIQKSQWKDNLELSAQRALAVTRELIKAGIPADDIHTIAMGAEHPVGANTSADGRAKNRRVVVMVTQ